MKVYIGDVTHFEDVKKAVEGVDVVIHAAAVIDVSPQPDTETMNAVNVEGIVISLIFSFTYVVL